MDVKANMPTDVKSRTSENPRMFPPSLEVLILILVDYYIYKNLETYHRVELFR